MKTIRIENFETHEWLIRKHYAKRIPPIEHSFGLYDGDILVGVCTFGTPAISNLRMIFDGKFKVFELNRLVVNENLPKNSLSFFVSQCLKMMPVTCAIVSYADTSQGHHGYIYQATNWIYTGLSAKRPDWKIKGMENLHGSTIVDLSRGHKNRAQFMRDKYGDDFYIQERPRKHRYFYFIGKKRERKEMLQMLPYEQLPYPKGENKRYDASAMINPQLRLL